MCKADDLDREHHGQDFLLNSLLILIQLVTHTYLDISSLFMSFMSEGMILVASSPELYGFGSWPLNSERRNCRFQLKRGKK